MGSKQPQPPPPPSDSQFKKPTPPPPPPPNRPYGKLRSTPQMPPRREKPCRKCLLLQELFEATLKSDRAYWVMTELFVELHDGDVCPKPEEPIKAVSLFDLFVIPVSIPGNGRTYPPTDDPRKDVGPQDLNEGVTTGISDAAIAWGLLGLLGGGIVIMFIVLGLAT